MSNGGAGNRRPATVGPAQRLEAEMGSLMDFCPPRPTHLLPYYHGRRPVADVLDKLVKKGDFLIVADERTGDLSLCVKTVTGQNHRQPIVKRADGKFAIEGDGSQYQMAFTNVEELVNYYQVYRLPVAEERIDGGQSTPIELTTSITARDDIKPPSDRRRAFRRLKDLNHFHGQLSPQEAEKLLDKPGDYLLRENPEKRLEYLLSARGDTSYTHQKIERNQESGGYVLPALDKESPIECVGTIDEWVQFHVLYGEPIDGIKLIRAVKKEQSSTL